MNKKIKTIALIAPCGDIRDFCDLDKKIKILEKNFKVKKYYNENKQNNYLSDTDTKRIKYLERAFLDDEVDLVLNIRGGFGALRIVDKINYDLIKNCNKYYASSSDGTILLMALYKKTKIKCFHSLMMTNGFIENLQDNINIIENNIYNLNLEKLYKKEKSAKGILWGGNLSSLVSLLSNMQFLPSSDIILFLEDINEPLYKIDKMLYEIYRHTKLRKKIKGMIFGDFYLNKNEIIPLLKEYSKLFDINTYITPDITHKMNNITLPFGKKIEL